MMIRLLRFYRREREGRCISRGEREALGWDSDHIRGGDCIFGYFLKFLRLLGT